MSDKKQAFLNIIEYVNDIDGALSEVCFPVKEITPELSIFIDNMIFTMLFNGGIGLAAPQVGKPLQIIVTSGVPFNKEDPIVLINPDLSLLGEAKDLSMEYCMSFPGMSKYVERYVEAQVTAYDREMKNRFVLYGEGIAARILQHEVDHCLGITLMDK